MEDDVEETTETNPLGDMSLCYSRNPALEGMDLQYVMARSTDMHMHAKWSKSAIMQNIFQQMASAISPLLHCETTAVPFKMASRLIFIALFYLHIM